MIKGFFFDLDGTLVNTYEADYLAYADAIEEVVGIRVSRPDFAATNGKEMRDKLGILTPGISEEDIKRIAKGKKRYYPNYLHLTQPNEWLIQLMARFVEHHSMVLVTSAKQNNALRVLRHHKLTSYFTDMVFGEEVAHPKPAPDPYLLALQRAGLKSNDVLAFEDSESGIMSAERAGISVVRVRDFVE